MYSLSFGWKKNFILKANTSFDLQFYFVLLLYTYTDKAIWTH